MKAQMRFQKYVCLAMLLVGILGLLYAFFYLSGSMAELGQAVEIKASVKTSVFTAAEGKYDSSLFDEIQPFNNALMACGIVMIVLAVLLYITATNKRRNYYITNYVATGICAGGNIIMSLILMVFNGIWRGKFLNVDFEAWYKYYDIYRGLGEEAEAKIHYSDSTLWFDLGFVVYILIILASIVLILNLVWKIKLMQGERKLLNGGAVEGGAV